MHWDALVANVGLAVVGLWFLGREGGVEQRARRPHRRRHPSPAFGGVDVAVESAYSKTMSIETPPPDLDPEPDPKEKRCIKWVCPAEGPCTCKEREKK